MTTTRITEKLSAIVSNQVPEFVQSDFPTFVAFVEAYYKFLEQDSGAQEVLQNALSYNDVDRTITSFIENFQRQYCDDIPRIASLDKKVLVKKIKDLYTSKGTEKGFHLLFRLLFDKEVEVYYPSNQILRASDGKWIQRSSIFLQTVYGNPDTILDKNVLITSDTSQYTLFVQEKDICSSLAGISEDIFEFFIDNRQNVPINVGDRVEAPNYKGIVIAVPNKFTISNPGTGFRVGDVFTLEAGAGNTTRIKVTKISTGGGIVNVQLVSSGIGYTSDFYNFFTSSTRAPASTTFTFIGGAATITDSTRGFVDRGTVSLEGNYALSYFAEDFTGTLLRDFVTSTAISDLGSTSLGSLSDASIFVELGSVINYPGHYDTTDGFLSDVMYLEDDAYYQPYSYVLRIDERLEKYKKAVMDIIHPAGTRMFGELVLESNFNVITEIASTVNFLRSILTDSYSAVDSLQYSMSKILSDNTTPNDNFTYLYGAVQASNTTVSDFHVLEISSNIESNISITDSLSLDISLNFITTEAPYASEYFLEDYVENLSASFISFSDEIDITVS